MVFPREIIKEFEMKVKSVCPPGGWIFSGLLKVIIWPDGESRLVLAELTYILSESSTRKENVLSPGFHKSRSCWLTGRCLTCGVYWNLSKLAFYKILCKPSKTRCNLLFERDSISHILKFLTKPCTVQFLNSFWWVEFKFLCQVGMVRFGQWDSLRNKWVTSGPKGAVTEFKGPISASASPRTLSEFKSTCCHAEF